MKRTTAATVALATAALLAATLAVAAPATADVGPQHMLGVTDVREVLPDNSRSRVLVTGDGSLVAVDAATGDVTNRIDGLGVARSMARAGNEDRVWISTNTSVVEVNLVTFSVTKTVDLPAGCQGRSIAWGLSRVWVALSCGAGGGLGSLVPTDASPTVETASTADLGFYASAPNVFASPSGQQLYLTDLSNGGRFALTAGSLTLKVPTPPEMYSDSILEWDDDGPSLLDSTGLRRFDPITLEPGQQVGGSSLMGVQASTESDRILLEGYSIYIVDGDGQRIRSMYGGAMEHNGAAWLPGDRVVLASDESGKGYVVFLDAAAKYPTDLSVGGGAPPTSLDQMTLSGSVSHSGNHVEGEPVVLERTVSGPPGGSGTAPQGTAVAGTAFTDALGNFAFSDTVHAAPSNKVTWTLRYEETATYEGASWSISRTADAMPYDFNGDGYEDMAVGAPLENVGSIRDAGAVTVSYGGPSGLSAVGSQTWTQDSPGVVGASETGDQFGYATTSFDYDHNGYADLIVGANNEAVGSQLHCGYITVIKGSAGGLTGTSSHGVTGDDDCAGGYFGESLAGVHDQFGSWSLMVGAPGLDTVYTVSTSGFPTPYNGLTENSPNVPGLDGKYNEGFGESLAVGDFNGDGVDDLAIGIPYDYDDRGYNSGAVLVTYGYLKKTSPPKPHRYSLDTTDIVGAEHPGTATTLSDHFGSVLAAGDLNGDGLDDLAIGAPGTDTPAGTGVAIDGGQVTLLYGAADGMHPSASTRITQESTDVIGSASTRAYFGDGLAIGLDRPGTKDSLFISEFGKQSVHVLPGGLGTGSVRLTQETTGIPDSTETGDGFGWFIRPIQDKGFQNPADVLIASPVENGYGALTIVPSTPTGATGLGAVVWTEDTPGIPGASEAGDYWGWLGSSR